jgi:hypothetical protein
VCSQYAGTCVWYRRAHHYTEGTLDIICALDIGVWMYRYPSIEWTHPPAISKTFRRMQLREWIWHDLIRSTRGVWPANLWCHETETEMTSALQFPKELKVFLF